MMHIDIIKSLLILPNTLSEYSITLIILTSFFSSFISSIIGFGGGIILLGVLASTLPPFIIIPLHAAIQTGSNLNRLLVFRFNVHWPIIIPFFLGCLIGVPLGGKIFVSLNENLILILIGSFILISTIGSLPLLNGKKLFFSAIISSFLSTIVGASGAIISLIVQSFNLEKSKYISSCAFMLLSQHILKCVIFGILGYSLQPYISLIFLTILSGVFGTIFGRLIVLKIKDYIFTIMIKVVLMILSFNLIYKGISNYFL